jgi:hypothetical protein
MGAIAICYTNCIALESVSNLKKISNNRVVVVVVLVVVVLLLLVVVGVVVVLMELLHNI